MRHCTEKLTTLQGGIEVLHGVTHASAAASRSEKRMEKGTETHGMKRVRLAADIHVRLPQLGILFLRSGER
jgi:hypothetical protein